MKFEWSPRKAAANKVKHGVSFEEALSVFSDRLARIFDDEAHSQTEHREIIIGHSFKGRLLMWRLWKQMWCGLSAPERRRRLSSVTMKKAPAGKTARRERGLAREYRFDYAKARPNRFAARLKANSVAVVLDPDVAAVFKSSRAVNDVLRSLLSAMPPR